MFGKKFYYNSQEISVIADDYIVWLTGIDWINIQSSKQRTNISGYHGVRSGPTYIRGRQITIEGGIQADTRDKSLDAMYYLRNLFSLKPIGSSQTAIFSILDEKNKLRNTEVEIVTPIEFIEGDNDSYDGSVRKWRVVLFANDARFESSRPNVVGAEGGFGGLFIDDNLFWAWDSITNSILCTPLLTGQISETIIRLTPIATVDWFVKVVNLTTWAVFKFTLTEAVGAGKIIEINSKTRKILVDGVDKTNYRIPWSIRPFILWATEFLVYDEDANIISDFDVEIQFYDVLI